MYADYSLLKNNVELIPLILRGNRVTVVPVALAVPVKVPRVEHKLLTPPEHLSSPRFL